MLCANAKKDLEIKYVNEERNTENGSFNRTWQHPVENNDIIKKCESNCRYRLPN